MPPSPMPAPAPTGRKPVLLVFCGGMGGSPLEELVSAAQIAAGLDSIERALRTDAFAGALFVTDRPETVEAPAGVEVIASSGPFHFGSELARLITERGIERPLYFGGGAAPLLTAGDFAAIAAKLIGGPVVVSNNFYSADLVGFTPGSAIAAVPPPATDNPLARLLHEHAGLPSDPLTRTIATQLDIDTPTSLAVLALHGGFGPRLGRVLCTADLPLDLFRRAAHVFVDHERTALIAGRVGSHVWQYLERETACRVRLFAEERGMQADGREEAGLVRSLLGMYLAEVGFDRFFASLAELCDAAFIDTRVLTAHARRSPGRRDRFLSDVGRWQEIADPFLRDLTAAAMRAPVPVLLGGHALVSGGLMALVQAAWDEHDRELGLGNRE
jgi:hypothetical protein